MGKAAAKLRRSGPPGPSRPWVRLLCLLAIDPGSRRAGWAALSALAVGTRSHLVLSVGCLSLGSGPDSERLERLRIALSSLRSRLGPEAVVIESLFVNLNWRSSMTLCYYRGVCLLTARGLGLLEMHNARVKVLLTGYMWPSKELTAASLGWELSAHLEPGDAADAGAFALTALKEGWPWIWHGRASLHTRMEGAPRALKGGSKVHDP